MGVSCILLDRTPVSVNFSFYIASQDGDVEDDKTEGTVNKIDLIHHMLLQDRLCGLAVRVLGYRSGGPGSIPGTTKKM
jgi:hypothetical protein